MGEHTNEYADIPQLIRELNSVAAGSPEHRRRYDAIVRRTLPVAEHTARRFRGRGQSHDDLVQVASLGLVNAITRFDPDNGSDFLAFAVPTIMGEIRRHFRDFGWAVKVPRRLKELNGEITRARNELSQTSGRAPTPSEIAEHLDIDRDEVVQALIAGSNYSTVSTDTSRGPDDDAAPFMDTVGDTDLRLDRVVDAETVRPLIESLPEREQALLRMRFFDDMTQSQIAARLGCSQMHVSRLLASALATVRDQVTGGAAPTGPVPTRTRHRTRVA